MVYVWNVFVFYVFCYISVECLIPGLRVQTLDRKLIERKRQDTLDMCRMFTEENERFNKGEDIINRNVLESKWRVKRDLKPTNFSLSMVEAKRVETIVDKLYDDMADHGEKVTYRQRKLSTVKTPLTVQNQTGRRFNFAPASLSSLSNTSRTMLVKEGDNYVIPWMKNWKLGIIPYFIDPNTYDTHLSDIMIRAFDYFEKATCIRLQRLRERPTDKESLQKVEWLYITNPSGIRQCVHSNERKPNRGVQMVVFGYDCLSLGEVLHEVMHILGFSHEHTRPDRDQYVTVLWDNIKPGYKKYFEVRTVDPLASLPYDYSSVLHYPPRAFSRNGQITLMVESGVKVGQREGLSDTDIAKVSMIYSAECMKRNKEYLLNTCPSVVKPKRELQTNVSQKEIENYFKDRLWPYGIVNYKIKDKMEFSIEERENLDAVIRHIEKETCIEFRDISVYDIDESNKSVDDKVGPPPQKEIDTEPQNTNINKTEDKQTEQGFEGIDNNNHLNSTTTDRTIEIEKKMKKKSIENNLEDSDERDPVNNSIDTEENLIDLRKNHPSNADAVKNSKKRNKSSSKSSYSFGSLLKIKPPQRNRPPRDTTVGRRHAESTLILTRSPEPGCRCPSPGKPTGDQKIKQRHFITYERLLAIERYWISIAQTKHDHKKNISRLIYKVLKINSDCFNSVNDLLHLFVHVLGLDHQHNMHDRDSYLHILWTKLTPEIYIEMQNILPPAASVGFPYDYQSVMHYPWLQIKNGVTNIMYPTWNDGWAMGHWQGLSSTDVNKLNLIYFEQCSLRKQHTQE